MRVVIRNKESQILEVFENVYNVETNSSIKILDKNHNVLGKYELSLYDFLLENSNGVIISGKWEF